MPITTSSQALAGCSAIAHLARIGAAHIFQLTVELAAQLAGRDLLDASRHAFFSQKTHTFLGLESHFRYLRLLAWGVQHAVQLVRKEYVQISFIRCDSFFYCQNAFSHPTMHFRKTKA